VGQQDRGAHGGALVRFYGVHVLYDHSSRLDLLRYACSEIDNTTTADGISTNAWVPTHGADRRINLMREDRPSRLRLLDVRASGQGAEP
jgi:hypothetical protein